MSPLRTGSHKGGGRKPVPVKLSCSGYFAGGLVSHAAQFRAVEAKIGQFAVVEGAHLAQCAAEHLAALMGRFDAVKHCVNTTKQRYVAFVDVGRCSHCSQYLCFCSDRLAGLVSDHRSSLA